MDNFILLHGGVDINPALYGEKPHPKTQRPNIIRDERELALVKAGVENGIPIIGVCRGAQFLCAFNGGTLYQHSDDHGCSHSITTSDGIVFEKVAAGHHQVMNPKGIYTVFGYDSRCTTAYDSDDRPHTLTDSPEIIWFPQTNSLAIQPHPEWMNNKEPFVVWLNDLIFNLMNVKGVF